MIMFSASAPIFCSITVVQPATSNSSGILPLRISINAFHPNSPSLFTNRKSLRLKARSTVLLSSDTSSGIITAVLVYVTKTLAKRVDTLWETRK